MDKIYAKRSTFMLRFDRGEEFIGALKGFCLKEKIQGGWFYGLGAISGAELAFYNLTEKKYYGRVLSQPLEVAFLSGNIGVKDNELIVHCHGVFSDKNMQTFGGHVNKLVVAATLEVFLNLLPAINRHYSNEIGLNLLRQS